MHLTVPFADAEVFSTMLANFSLLDLWVHLIDLYEKSNNFQVQIKISGQRNFTTKTLYLSKLHQSK